MNENIDKKYIIDTLTLDLHQNIRRASDDFDRIKMKLEVARKDVNLSPLYWQTIQRDINRVVLIKKQLRDLEIMENFYRTNEPLNFSKP